MLVCTLTIVVNDLKPLMRMGMSVPSERVREGAVGQAVQKSLTELKAAPN